MKISKQPLVSIIMNCHNGEKYLKESIKSVLVQNYKNWELIFLNNCSNDNSKKIFKKFNDKRLKYFETRSFQNLYEARNLAIKKVKGKFIGFLDTDDLWEKEKLKYQIDLINKKKFKIIYSNYYTLKNKKKFKTFDFFLPSGKITDNLVKKYFIGILTLLIEKKIFIHYKFNKKYNIIGDFDLLMKLSTKYNIGAIQKPLATYRVHRTNLSNSKIETHINELEEWIDSNVNIFKKYSINLTFQKIYLLKLKVKKLMKKIFGRVVQW